MKGYRFATGFCVVASLLAACSGASHGGSATGTSPTGASPSTSTAAPNGVPADIVAQATADTQRPTSIGYNDPFKGQIPKGKTIAFITCGAPSCFSLGKPVKAAALALGWKYREINAGLTPETVQAAWDTMLQNPPDGIVTLSFPSSIFAKQLKKTAALGIPVVTQSTSDVVGGGLGAVYTDMKYFCVSGERLARQVLVGGGMGVESVMFETNAYVTLAHQQECYKNYMAKVCPQCKVNSVELPTSSIGTDFAQREVSWLTAHPSVKWAYPSFVDVTIGLPQALKAAGLSGIKIVTDNSSDALNQEIKTGDSLVAINTYPNQEVSYRAVDFILRALSKQPTATAASAPLPSWVVTKENAPTDPLVNVEGGAAQFLKLWGVSG